MRGDNHLGYPLPGNYFERFIRKVDQYYLYLTPVIGIYGARAVQNGYSVLCGKTAAWSYLGFISFRKGNIQTGWDKRPFEGLEDDGRFKVGLEIKPGRKRSRILRQRVRGMVYDLYFHMVLLGCAVVQVRRNSCVNDIWQPEGYIRRQSIGMDEHLAEFHEQYV